MLGDILFTPSSETPTDIGHSVVVKEDMHDTVYSYHLVRFRPSSLIDVNYSNYFCNDEKILKQLASYAQGATRFTISLESFKKIKVAIPASIEEQQKIAGFLTDVDDKVSQEESMLKNAKQYKKALLQRMFV
jgi:type I restriction enzyme S subunit